MRLRCLCYGDQGSGSLGVLWSAFGIGAILGPILVNRLNDGSIRVMRRLIIIGYIFVSIGWFLIGGAPDYCDRGTGDSG